MEYGIRAQKPQKKQLTKDGYVINLLTDGCQANNAIGCYYRSTDDMYCCYITEGEQKGILGNSILHAFGFFIVGGPCCCCLLNHTIDMQMDR